MRVLQKDATSKTIYVFIRGKATTPAGMGLTGLAFGTAGLKFYYTRKGAAAAAITLATQTVTGAWSSGGFVEVDATNAPGLYRLDLPNAVIATGVDEVVVSWTGANTVDDGVAITLVSYDPVAVATSPWDDLRASHVTAGTFGEGVIVNSLAASVITAASIAADALTAAKIHADVTAELQSGLATSAAQVLLAADIATLLSNVATLLSRDSVYVKNVAVPTFPFPMKLVTGTPGTGLTVAGSISQDGGAFVALTNPVVEIGSGWYKVALTQAEMNADEVALKFTATGAIQRDIKIRTQS
jgi:hypothetical protein